MNYTTFLTALGVATMNASAGTSKSAAVETPPAPEPSLSTWFIGGTYGQLSDVDSNLGDAFDGLDSDNFRGLDVEDIDLDLFSLHVGRGITSSNGWDFAAYLEVAYLTGDSNVSGFFNDGEDLASFNADIDIEIIPVTLNFKVERQLFGPVSAYLTGGAGYAWTKFEAEDFSNDDGGFYAQASAGLIWKINQSFEMYGGARWLHLSDLNLAEDPDVSLDDSIAWEVGARYKF